jgi:hypothetical protein
MDALALLGDFTVRSVMLGAALVGIVAGTLGSFALLRRRACSATPSATPPCPASPSASSSRDRAR